MTEYLSFSLPDHFLSEYKTRTPNWGFPIGAGNTLGELTFLTKYSRKKPDGTKERWWECCQRVIEGSYSILKDHCRQNKTPWNENKAQRSAQEAYDRMFAFKWLPPGRGLWAMGTEMVNKERNSAALQNCGFLSTEKISSRSVQSAIYPFVRLMDMSMHGIGVGFDVKGAGKLTIHQPDRDNSVVHVIPDTREGWSDSLGVLLETFFFENRQAVIFDYSQIRPAGAPVKRFGGLAAGPQPLIDMHVTLTNLLSDRDGQRITETDIADIMNLAGKAVVAGGIRRSAEIALGPSNSQEFVNLKNWEVNPERMGENGWGHLSNNSVFANVGEDYSHLYENIALNGEPGLFYLDLCRDYGRLGDPPDYKDSLVAGTNPCSEQSLESSELCTLVETFPFLHDSLDDYLRTLKFAYLYGKAVTLLPTHWPETNEIMQRNRRIGCSMSGLAQFVEHHSPSELKIWCDKGYESIVARDISYSRWMGVRESIKHTSVKPSGTVSLLNGSTPGVHWPISSSTYIRRQRFAKHDPLVDALRAAGYTVEAAHGDVNYTVVVEFPTLGPDIRNEKQVAVWEKAALAAQLQNNWADNQVSCTLTFLPDEADQVARVISSYEGQMKSVSFLPIIEGGAFKQMPYENISETDWNSKTAAVSAIQWETLYAGESIGDAEGERFCANDVCMI